MTGITEYTETNSENLFLEEPIVLVHFYADWCKPCEEMTDIVTEINRTYSIPVVNVDVEQHNQLSMNYDIRTIPTVVQFENGTETVRYTGNTPKAKILHQVE